MQTTELSIERNQSPTAGRPFLTAEWRSLAMLNFEVDPVLLQPLIPAGTELDDWQGTTLMSLVGFRFLNTRVLGCRVPLHDNFEEVNLRFYVRRRGPEGWRRGVVFIKEIAPRRAVTLIARKVYGENYVTLPMGHDVRESAVDGKTVRSALYHWNLAGRRSHIRVETAIEPSLPVEGSQQQFIVEHYWGYTRLGNGRTVEYLVEHPPWHVAVAERCELECDSALFYGEALAGYLAAPPVSALLAEGSGVAVYRGSELSPQNL